MYTMYRPTCNLTCGHTSETTVNIEIQLSKEHRHVTKSSEDKGTGGASEGLEEIIDI